MQLVLAGLGLVLPAIRFFSLLLLLGIYDWKMSEPPPCMSAPSGLSHGLSHHESREPAPRTDELPPGDFKKALHRLPPGLHDGLSLRR